MSDNTLFSGHDFFKDCFFRSVRRNAVIQGFRFFRLNVEILRVFHGTLQEPPECFVNQGTRRQTERRRKQLLEQVFGFPFGFHAGLCQIHPMNHSPD
jgi:hypothetical protein